MKDLLLFAHNEVEKHSYQQVLPQPILNQIEVSYAQILTEGFAYHAFYPHYRKVNEEDKNKEMEKIFWIGLAKNRTVSFGLSMIFQCPSQIILENKIYA